MKETYYFSHDYNATQDPKMMALLSTCGLQGIGMYWIIIEILHQQPESKILYKSYEDYIEFYGRIDGENEHLLNNIKQMLINTELVVKDGDYIYSSRVLNNKKERERLSELRSLAGKKSAELRAKATSVEQVSTSVQEGKERKGKEIKGKDNKESSRFAPPSLSELEDYIKLNKYNVDAEQWINFYQSKGWLVGKSKMKDWQAAVRTWAKRNKPEVLTLRQEAINLVKQCEEEYGMETGAEIAHFRFSAKHGKDETLKLRGIFKI